MPRLDSVRTDCSAFLQQTIHAGNDALLFLLQGFITQNYVNDISSILFCAKNGSDLNTSTSTSLFFLFMPCGAQLRYSPPSSSTRCYFFGFVPGISYPAFLSLSSVDLLNVFVGLPTAQLYFLVKKMKLGFRR